MKEIKSGSYIHPYKSGTCILFYPYSSHHAGYKIIELLHANTSCKELRILLKTNYQYNFSTPLFEVNNYQYNISTPLFEVNKTFIYFF